MSDKETVGEKAEKIFTKGCGMYSFVTRLIVLICFCSILTCIGALIYRYSDDYKGRTVAHINSAICTSGIIRDGSRTRSNHNCNLELSYQVNGVDYSGNLTTSSEKMYVSNTNVDINYDLNDPKLIKIYNFFSTKFMGIISIIIAGLCLISSFIHIALYFTNEWYEHSLCADLFRTNTYNSYDYGYGYGYQRPSLISIF